MIGLHDFIQNQPVIFISFVAEWSRYSLHKTMLRYAEKLFNYTVLIVCLCVMSELIINSPLYANSPAGHHLSAGLKFYHLNNGLRVVLAPQGDKNTVTVRWSVQVGALDEKEGEHGYAHLFEHMMFKGTPTIGDGEYFNIINQIGGKANAETNFDVTTYFASFPPAALKQVLWLEADRLKHLEMTPEKLKNQISAVLEEKTLFLDNQPYASALAAFARKSAKGSGYEGLVIGLEQDLRQASPKSVQRFYDHYYHPANIVLAVSGNFNPHMAQEWINNYFSSWAKPGKIDIRSIRMPAFNLPTFPQTLHDPLAPYPAYLFAWLQPGRAHHYCRTNELIAQMLLKGKNSLLKQQLRLDENSFLNFSASINSDKLSIQGVAIAPRSYASKKDVISSLEHLVSTPAHSLFTDQLLHDAILAMELRHAETLEYPETFSNFLVEGVRLHQDPLALFKQQDQLHAVTLIDIHYCWKRYWQQPDIILEVTGNWKISWGKLIMQWLPKGAAIWLEDCFLQD